MTIGDRQLIFFHTAKSWRRRYNFSFLLLFAMKSCLQRDDGVLPSGIFQQLPQAQDRVFDQRALFDIGGRRIVLRGNGLYSVSVV